MSILQPLVACVLRLGTVLMQWARAPRNPALECLLHATR